jgi:serine/threonine-protein kinase
LKAGLIGESSEFHDVTITFGPATSSVLASFGQAFGDIPHVLLRDTDSVNDPGPVIKPSSPEMPDAAERSARLQLFGEIARGGMGVVLKGRDADLGRDLAVKILLETHRDKPEMIRRFIEEAQIAGQLQHPGIVPIYELGAFGDRRPYFAMKLVKGHTLAEILGNRKTPNEGLERFLANFQSICQTIAYAHARGVIHRDLKPTNVMVGSFGEVQVMDWGLAKVLPKGGAVEDASAGHTRESGTVIATARSGSDPDLSQAGSVMGTPSYMAPEQARGEVDQVDERADVFALGSILCEILTSQPAFTGRSSGEIQRKAARGDLTDALSRVKSSNAGPELIAQTEACLSSESLDRPRHAGEVAERMDAYRTGVQERLRQAELARAQEAARAEEATKRASVERDRLRLAIALAASILVLVVLGGGGGFWLYRQRQSRLADLAASLVRVQTLHEQAQRRGAEPLPWREAMAAAERAVASIGDLASTELGVRLTELRDRIAKDEEQAKRETTLLADLADVRSRRGLKETEADEGYTKAFRHFGLDLTTATAEEAITRLKALPTQLCEQVVAFLDDWFLAAGSGYDKNRPISQLALARRLDANPERNHLRTLLERPDLDGDANAIRAMSKQPSFIESGPSTALLLASALERIKEADGAIDILRAAIVRYPGDLWLNSELARRLQLALPPQTDDAIRYYSIFRALRPSSGTELADLLQNQQGDREAEAIRREMVKSEPDNPHNWAELIKLLKKHSRSDAVRVIREQWLDFVRGQIKLAPNEAIPHLKSAAVFKVMGDPINQIAELKEAARLARQGRDEFHHLLGHILLYYGDFAGAILAYQEAIRIDPSDLNYLYELAFSLCLNGSHE